jgi:hypothetical protein
MTMHRAALRLFVHEMGDAFASDAVHPVFWAAAQTNGNRRDNLIRQGDPVVVRTPAPRAHLDVNAGKPGPAAQRDSVPHEVFAEGFAPFQFAPDARQPFQCRVHASFGGDGHEDPARPRSSS